MKRNNRLVPLLALTVLVSLGFLTGCEQEGPVEKIGESIDESANDAERAIEDATD